MKKTIILKKTLLNENIDKIRFNLQQPIRIPNDHKSVITLKFCSIENKTTQPYYKIYCHNIPFEFEGIVTDNLTNENELVGIHLFQDYVSSTSFNTPIVNRTIKDGTNIDHLIISIKSQDDSILSSTDVLDSKNIFYCIFEIEITQEVLKDRRMSIFEKTYQ